MSEAHAVHAAHTAPKHPYHLVDPSPWPIVGAIAAGLRLGGGVLYMHGDDWMLMIVGVLCILAIMAVWWRDVIREATFQGYHTPVVQIGMRYGMALFIASEVMFFAAFFWAFFASSLFPVGGVWPPKGIHPFDPFELPFLNTLILLLSGTTVTWAHHSLLEGDRKGLIQGLAVTVLLGLCFTSCRPTSTATPPSTSPAASIPRPSSWRPGSTASTSSSARPSSPSACPGRARAIQARPSFRLRGRGVVLAFRRRGVAVPVHLHLLVGQRRRRGDRCVGG